MFPSGLVDKCIQGKAQNVFDGRFLFVILSIYLPY